MINGKSFSRKKCFNIGNAKRSKCEYCWGIFRHESDLKSESAKET
jgi:hypothetical protein